MYIYRTKVDYSPGNVRYETLINSYFFPTFIKGKRKVNKK